MELLTTQQQKAFEFIREHIEARQIAPTLRELCAFMHYNAIGSAQDMVAVLRRKGLLLPASKQAARSLSLTGLGLRLGRLEDSQDLDEFLIPCLGSVPAGNPLEALEDRVGELRISSKMLPKPHPKPKHMFALKAQGSSMIGAGILDGDWLIVRAQNEADHGSIVVARVDGEATVKRLMYERAEGCWVLKPENPDYSIISARDRLIEVIGRVIALQRVFS
jgi:repressor LexA